MDDDFLRIDATLTDNERLIRDSTRRWVDEHVLPIIAACAREARFPLELVPAMAAMGFFGGSLNGASSVEYGLMMQELERGDSAVRSFASVQSALVMYPIHAFGSGDQRQRWLPPLRSGEAVGCFGLTEPDFGSNPGAMRTRARRTGNGEIEISGEKAWITNGSIAHLAVIWAKEGETNTVSGYLVETDRPGVRAETIHGKHALRASVTANLVLDAVRIPASNALPGAVGLKHALQCLDQARYGIGWGAIGAASACYTAAREYALTRKQFHGRPIASHQLVQAKLVEMASGLAHAQLLALHVARLKDRGEATAAHISLFKRDNVAMALATARAARDILGANGIASDYPVFRHMANLEAVSTYEGTHDIHTLILGHAITGIEAFG